MNEINQHLKQVQSLDDELLHLKAGYERTKNKWLYAHLLLLYPFMEFFRLFFHGILKSGERWKDTNDKFPILQLFLVVFNGTIFWSVLSGTETGSFLDRYLDLLKTLPNDILMIGISVIWYFSTVTALRLKVTNPRSKYFLWRAYRKWDSHYQWNGFYIENFPTIKVIETSIAIAESPQTHVITANEVENLYNNVQDLIHSIQEKDFIIDLFMEMNDRLYEIILKHERMEFKHLNLIDMPFCLYKKVDQSLALKHEENMREPVEPVIPLSSRNLYTHVYKKRKSPVIKDGRIGFKIRAHDGTEWVIVYKPKNIHDFEVLEKYKVIIATEFHTILKTLISRIH